MEERASSGIVGLDDVLGGKGFPAGQIYLVKGAPGAGKTTVGLQFLMAGVKAGEACAYVVLSETELSISRMAASHGWKLDGIRVVESNEQDSNRDYSIYEPAEIELGETNRALFARLDEIKPRRVVIDSLSEVRLLAQDPLRYRRQLIALRRYFTARGCTVLLLDFDQSGTDNQLESLCHGILQLSELAPEYGGQRRRLRVVKLRESQFRDGYHDFEIVTGGLNVFPRLVAAEHDRPLNPAQGRVSSGVGELDQITCGGLDRGSSTLVLGPAGAGKSTLTMQYVKAALERGEVAAIFTFDEQPSTLLARADGMSMPLRSYVEAGTLAIHQIDPAELSPGKLIHRARHAVDHDRATVVVIDSVNGYQSAMPEEHYLSAHMHELLAFLSQRGVCTLLVLAQAGLIGNNMSSPVDLSYLADTVIVLRFFEVDAEIRQAISVVKRRMGPHERTIRELRMDASGLRVGAPLTDFHGILTGVPAYGGETRMLPSREGSNARDQR